MYELDCYSDDCFRCWHKLHGASRSRKAQKRAREEANLRELIEGAAPNIICCI
jgi:hypothetical protein